MFGAVQVRAARAILSWSLKELAQRAGLHPNTVGRVERSEETTKGTLALLQMTFERAGVRFHEDGCVCPPADLQSAATESGT